jgi:hypothetical protein
MDLPLETAKQRAIAILGYNYPIGRSYVNLNPAQDLIERRLRQISQVACWRNHFKPGAFGRARGSLDHPVRSRQHIRRNRQADGFGRLEVDDKLELRRLLDWEIGGLPAL